MTDNRKIILRPDPIGIGFWTAHREGYDLGQPVGMGKNTTEAAENLLEWERLIGEKNSRDQFFDNLCISVKECRDAYIWFNELTHGLECRDHVDTINKILYKGMFDGSGKVD